MKEDTVCFELKKIVEKMNYEADAVLVEGLRDKKALMKIGFKNRVIKCASNDIVTIERFTRRCSSVVILTDFDKQGKKLNKKLSSYLQFNGIKIKGIYRKKIREVLKDRNTIESINNICSNNDEII